MPVGQILGHLQSKDILNLARTSKDFRALLLNRQNAFIWKAARKGLPGELPDPHPYMSEPALAQLMFSGHCQVSAFFTSPCCAPADRAAMSELRQGPGAQDSLALAQEVLLQMSTSHVSVLHVSPPAQY